jgi:hypothetical protein
VRSAVRILHAWQRQRKEWELFRQGKATKDGCFQNPLYSESLHSGVSIPQMSGLSPRFSWPFVCIRVLSLRDERAILGQLSASKPGTRSIVGYLLKRRVYSFGRKKRKGVCAVGMTKMSRDKGGSAYADHCF